MAALTHKVHVKIANRTNVYVDCRSAQICMADEFLFL